MFMWLYLGEIGCLDVTALILHSHHQFHSTTDVRRSELIMCTFYLSEGHFSE